MWNSNVRPRMDHAPFVRHVRRTFNSECDALATQGKHLLETKLDLHVAETNGRFWKGAWDGGYDTNSEYVGLGFKIWVTDDVEVVDEMLQPVRWMEKAYGVGSVKGEGATTAEVMAFQCLVITLQSLMKNKEVPIEECLGISVSRHLFAHSCPIPSL